MPLMISIFNGIESGFFNPNELFTFFKETFSMPKSIYVGEQSLKNKREKGSICLNF